MEKSKMKKVFIWTALSLVIIGAGIGGYIILKPKIQTNGGNSSNGAATGGATGATTGNAANDAAAAKAAQTERTYKSLITQGDSLLALKQYDNAINRYKAALALKPNDKTAKDKIEEAEDSKPSALDLARLRLKSVINTYKQNGKFTNTSDAEFLIINVNSLEEADRPSTEDIKTVLRNSNMVFYDGKVTARMSQTDMQEFINTFAPTGEGGKRVMKFNGPFTSPSLATYTDYQLRKLLANGWWFGLWYDGGGTYAGHNQGYAATSAGGAYLVMPFNLWGGNDSHASKVTIPANLIGDEYSYSFNANKSYKY